MKLSIITPVLNGDQFIKKNIESIIDLRFPHEHIIVDGGSTDNTMSILKNYNHLRVFQQDKKNGMYGAIIQGFQEAKGEIITWINCDDYIIPGAYEKMINYMIEVDADLVYSNSFSYYQQSDKYIKNTASVFPKFFIQKGILPFIQPSSVYKKSFYESVSGLNEKYKITGDMDLFFRMAQVKNAKFSRFKSEPTVVFLKYGESLGDKNIEKGMRELMDAGIPFPNALSRIAFKVCRLLF